MSASETIDMASFETQESEIFIPVVLIQKKDNFKDKGLDTEESVVIGVDQKEIDDDVLAEIVLDDVHVGLEIQPEKTKIVELKLNLPKVVKTILKMKNK